MNINVGQSAKVVLPVKSVAITRTVKVGNNLDVYLSNGSVITLENYFPNKPTLLTNEGNNQVTELTISDNGEVVGIKELSADEAASMLSNAYSSLSSEPNHILLLSASDVANTTSAATATTTKSYAVEAIGAYTALVAGMFIASDKSSKSPTKANNTEVTKHQDGSTTTTERVDSDKNGTLDTEVITKRDASGKITQEIRKTDTNGSGKPEKIVTTKINKDGTKTVTVEESTKDNGVFDKSVETTTNQDGSKKVVESRDTDNDGTKDNVITTETNKDGSKITTEQKSDGSTITTKDDGKGTTVINKDDGNGNISIETKNPDGTSTKQETKSDGTKIDTETDSNGITTSTATKPDGSSQITTITPDGKGGSTSTTVFKDKSGKITATENAIDKNNDGHPEAKTKTETKSDGTTVTTKTEDVNSDGKPESITQTETKPNGETVSVTKKQDGTVTTTVSKPNADKSVTSTIVTKNNDGEVVATTEKVTQPDGSSVANTTRLDGSTSITKDNGKGTVTIENRDPSGKLTDSTTTVTKANGSSVSTTKKADGTSVTTTTKPNKDGSTSATAVEKDANNNIIATTETKTKPNGDSTSETKYSDGTSTTVTKTDTNGDGTQDTTVITEKDKNGKVISTETSVDLSPTDGNPETVTKVEPQADGSTKTTVTKDSNSDGKVDSVAESVAQSNGTTTKKVEHKDENGKVIGTSETNTTPDGKGGSVSHTVHKDVNGEVTGKTETTTKPDGKGGETTTTIEKNKDDQVISKTETQKNADGSSTSEKTNTDGTSSVTKDDGKGVVTTTEKDKDNNIVSTETVIDKEPKDGNPESVIKTETKPDGTKVTTATVDKNSDGKVDSQTTTTTNSDGTSTVEKKEDTNGDGILDTNTTIEKTKDGKITSIETVVDKDADGNPESTITTTKRPDGSSTTVVKNQDGSTSITATNGKDTIATVGENGATVSGTTKPGATVTVTDEQGNELGKAVANNKGEYNVTLNQPKTNGETVNVNVKDPAGKTTTTPITVLDTTPPEAPSAENTQAAGNKESGTVTITGKTEPGATVVIKDANGEKIGEGKANKEGNYSVELTKPDNAKNGETLTVEVTDKSNNTVKANITAPDVTPPVAPSAENTQAAGNKDNGTVTVTGKTEPGATVVIKDANGEKIGEGKANKEGNYSVELTKPDNAKNGETLNVEVTDKAGQTTKGTITAADITPPEAPNAEEIKKVVSEDKNKVTISGKTEPGATVVIKDANGEEIGKAKADEKSGEYSVELTKPDNAKNGETLTVEVTDKAGHTTKGTISAPDVTAPVAPNAEEIKKVASEDKNTVTISGTTEPGATVVIKDAKGKEIGKAKADEKSGEYSVKLTDVENAKNGETLTVEVTDKSNNTVKANITAPDVTAPVAPNAQNTNVVANANDSITVKGKTEPGATVVIKDKNDNEIGGAEADKDGNYDITLNDATNAKNGETLTIEVTDKAKHKTTGTITAPDVTPAKVPDAEEVQVTGNKDNGGKVTISGKTEPGATIVIRDADGEEIGRGKANDESGQYSVELTKADNAKNGEKLTLEITDKSNKPVTAEITAPDITPPKAPTEVKVNKVGNVLTGQNGEPGSTIEVKAPGSDEVIAKGIVEENGTFSIKVPTTAPENVLVIAKDKEGNTTDAQPVRLPDLSDPLTAVVQEDKKVSTYTDLNHDGIVDTAEVATYETKPTLNERTKEVENEAKILQIDHYLESSDIAAGDGKLDAANNGQKLELKDPDQRTYFIYDDAGNLKKRLYDLDAKNAETGQTVDQKSGIDRYETIEASETKTISVKGNNGVVETKEVVLETQIAFNNDAKDGDDAREYREYDQQGRKTRVFYDDNADGNIDRAEKYTYSNDLYNPNPIKIEYDSDANGVTKKGDNTKPTFELDEQKFDKVEYFEHETRTTKVKDVDVTEYVTTAKYVNTDNKSETGSTQQINGESVQGIDTIEKYDYNDYNRQTKIEYDFNGDGTTDKIHYQQFDSLGRVSKIFVDNDNKENTGKVQSTSTGDVKGIDLVLEYDYNIKGEVTSLKRDNNVDGKYDYREAYTLNANGNWIAKQVDLTNDGTFDRKEVYTKEADDGLVKTNFYNLVEGREVLTKVEDYTLNTNNHRTSMKVDRLGNGTTDAITHYELDALGRTAKAYFDTNGDGTVDRVERYTYGGNNYVEKTELLSTDVDENVLQTTTYTRDVLGRATLSEITNSNGELIRSEVREIDPSYGYTLSLSEYSGSISPENFIKTRNWVYNELGQAIETHQKLANGKERIWTRTFNEYGFQNYENELNISDKSVKSQLFITEFTDKGQALKLFRDNDVNGVFSQGDQIEVREYDTLFNKVIHNAFYSDEATTKISNQYFYELNELGDYTVATRDWNGDGKLNSLMFTGGVGFIPVSHTENITLWDDAKFAERATITQIQLINSPVIESTVVLDQATLAKFNANRLLILEGAADDKVILLNGQQDFTQTQNNITSGNRTYDVYATANGKELWIQDGITVDLDNTGVI